MYGIRDLQELFSVIWGCKDGIPMEYLPIRSLCPPAVGRLAGDGDPSRGGWEGVGVLNITRVEELSVLQYVIPYVWQLVFTQAPV